MHECAVFCILYANSSVLPGVDRSICNGTVAYRIRSDPFYGRRTMTKLMRAKMASVALAAGVASLVGLSGWRFAGYDEANMYSFMMGKPVAAAPADTSVTQGIPSDARANYQGYDA